YTATPWRGTWATDGGGVLMTQAIHYVDLLQWYLGDVEWVMTAADTFVHGDHIEVEDTLAATMRLSSGAIAQFAASTALTPGRRRCGRALVPSPSSPSRRLGLPGWGSGPQSPAHPAAASACSDAPRAPRRPTTSGPSPASP